jgi:LPXTG-motif cell wall-anchored protein
MKTEHIILAALGIAVVGGGAWYFLKRSQPQLSPIEQKLKDSNVNVQALPSIITTGTRATASKVYAPITTISSLLKTSL